MKKPSPLTLLLGNKRACAVASCGAVLIVYGWYTGQLAVPWFLPIIAVSFAFKTFKAKRQVASFMYWQSQWNAMAGIAPAPTARARKRSWAVMVWLCLLAYVIWRPIFDPAINGCFDTAFMIFSLWLVARFLWRTTHRVVRESREKSARKMPHIARICLAVPSGSPSASEATAALPEYCRDLLRRQSARPEKQRA